MTDNIGYTSLHRAAQNGSYELFKFLSDKGADISLKTKNGVSCLHIAAFNEHLTLCKTLINKHNFDVHISSIGGFTALHSSAQIGNYELVKFFAAKGGDIFLKTKSGMNCLHIAACNGHLNLCKLLINEEKFDLFLACNNGFMALHFSAKYGSYELIKFFAEKMTDIHLKRIERYINLRKISEDKRKCNIHVTNIDEMAGLFCSARTSTNHLPKFPSCKLADIHMRTKSGLNCLHIAAFNGHLNLCKILINKHYFDVNMTDNGGIAPLHASVRYGKYELIKFFADKVADIYVKTKSGMNCLHIAAHYGYFNLCDTLIKKHNFDVHMTDVYGWTALRYSAQYGSYELVNFLVDMGIDIHLKTKNGMNCLHIAARKGHLDLCKTLVNKHKFDVRMTDNNGWISLHFSVENGRTDLINFLTDMGADNYHKTNCGKNCLHIASLNGHLDLCKMFLDNHKFDIHISDNDGWTPLHCSAKNGSFELFSYLLDKGSEIYCKTKDMENILHLSAANGHFDICEFVLEYFTKDYEVNSTKNQYALYVKSYKSQVFYKYSAIFLHAMNNDGNTYLHLAANGNHSKVCKLLLKYDVEITTLLNKKDETARDIAKKNDCKDVLKALKAQYDRTGRPMFDILFILIKTFYSIN